ncbi:MAG: DUF6660 family protein [Bacteroidota bacterium]
MRLRYLLLAVYVFLSALYPCRDSDLHEDPIENAVAVVADHDHSHSGLETDICTPFCICSCCAAHIKISTPDAIDASKPEHNTKLLTIYIEHPFFSLKNSIWQPPRIS